MHDVLMKIRILVSAEANLARIMARRLASRASLLAIAAGLLLLAMVMIDVGAYFLLAQTHSQSTSAFVVAAANAVLAVIVAIVATRLRPGEEERLARQIREMALDELNADVEELKDQVGKVGSDVRRVRSGFSILAKGGSIGAGLASVAPVISMVVDSIKEHRKEKKEKKEQAARKEEETPNGE